MDIPELSSSEDIVEEDIAEKGIVFRRRIRSARTQPPKLRDAISEPPVRDHPTIRPCRLFEVRFSVRTAEKE
jgi:hypothetical protein